MTRRERILATTLVILVVVLGGGVLFHLFVWEPISTVQARLTAAQGELSKKQIELSQEQRTIEQVLRVNPRLSQWQKISLPPRDPEAKKQPGISLEERKHRHLTQMKVEYERYLSELLRSSGFRSDSISISLRTPDRRTSLSVPKGKEPLYERLAFGVKGKGTLESTVRMLRQFHSAPLLHQVRTFALTTTTPTGSLAARSRFAPGGATNSELDVNLTVEALLVSGAEERSSLIPSRLAYAPRVLAEPGRDYERMTRRNMFTGIEVAPVRRDETPVTEDRAEVLRFIKLTTLFYNPDRRRWEATMYDQARGPRRVEEEEEGVRKVSVIWEKQYNTRILNELKVQDRYDNTLLDATVVHIDGQQLIFKADRQYFRMRCGDTLYPVIENPLSEEEVKKLELE